MATARLVPVLSSDGSLSSIGDFQHLRQFRHARVVLLLGQVASRFERKRDIFRHGQRIKQRARLENHGHAAANLRQLVFGPIGDVLPGHEHAARPASETPMMLQRDRFSHAAAPHDHAGLAGIDEEADVIEHQ